MRILPCTIGSNTIRDDTGPGPREEKGREILQPKNNSKQQRTGTARTGGEEMDVLCLALLCIAVPGRYTRYLSYAGDIDHDGQGARNTIQQDRPFPSLFVSCHSAHPHSAMALALPHFLTSLLTIRFETNDGTRPLTSR